jgi:hypothetical protein
MASGLNGRVDEKMGSQTWLWSMRPDGPGCCLRNKRKGSHRETVNKSVIPAQAGIRWHIGLPEITKTDGFLLSRP